MWDPATETQPCHEMSGQNDTGGPQLTSCRSMHTWVTAIKAIRHGRHSASLLNSTQSLAICHRQLTDSNLEGFVAHGWQCHLLLPFHDEVHRGTGCDVFFMQTQQGQVLQTLSSFFAFEMLRSGFKNFHASIKYWISLNSWISMLHMEKQGLSTAGSKLLESQRKLGEDLFTSHGFRSHLFHITLSVSSYYKLEPRLISIRLISIHIDLEDMLESSKAAVLPLYSLHWCNGTLERTEILQVCVSVTNPLPFNKLKTRNTWKTSPWNN